MTDFETIRYEVAGGEAAPAASTTPGPGAPGVPGMPWAPVAPAAPVFAAGERDELLKAVYKDTDIPDKPRNLVGLAKSLPTAEMEALLGRTGFSGDLKAFIAFLRTDPRFYAATGDALLKETAHVLKRMDGELPKLFLDTVETNAVVLMLVMTASLLGWVLARAQVPQMLGAWILGTTQDPILILLMINVFLLKTD
jgi:hypothetical protein